MDRPDRWGPAGRSPRPGGGVCATVAAARKRETLDSWSVCWDCEWADKEPGTVEATAAAHYDATGHWVVHRSVQLVTFGGGEQVAP